MYSFEKQSNFQFSFLTKNLIEYTVYFKPSPYLLGDTNLSYSDSIFEFIIEVNASNNENKIPLDQNTGLTIAKILEEFYSEFNNTITVYICDSSDNRQEIRALKFEAWFERFNTDPSLIKISECLKDRDGTLFPISIILKLENPYFLEIVDKFRLLLQNYSK